MNKFIIRDVKIPDALRLAEIYNYYIENTIVTFDETKLSEEDMQQRIESVLQKNYPCIVAEEESQVVGYAYVNNWHSRSAARITLETTIYLDPYFVGKGLGTILYTELIQRASTLNIHSLLGILGVPNEASCRLHEKMGFHKVGYLKETGIKFGRLIGVEFWQYFI